MRRWAGVAALGAGALVGRVGSAALGIGTTSPAAALDVLITGTAASAIIVPRDTTTNRPSVPVNGMIRYNSSLNLLEGFVNGTWTNLATGAGSGVWQTNGSAAYYSAGDVGVGTSSPAAQFTVQNPSYLSPQVLIQDGGTAALPAFPGGITPALTISTSEVSGSRPLFFGYNTGSAWDALLTAGACGSFGSMCLDLGGGTSFNTALQANGINLNVGGGADGNFTNVSFQNTGGTFIGSTSTGQPLSVTGAGGTGLNNPLVSLTAASNNGYQTAVLATDGNLTGGNALLFALGHDISGVNNLGYLSFVYQGSLSTNNALSLGFNGNNQVYNFTAGGLFGISTTTPAAALDVAGTGTIASAIVVPRDTTANRPVAPVNGMLRYNTNLNALESYTGAAWSTLPNGSIAGGGTGNSSMAFVTLTDGATVTWTVAGLINNATVTLGGNRTLAFSGLTNGMTGTLIVKQDATGGRTLTLPSACTNKVISGGGSTITLSNAASAIDMLTFTYDGTNCYWQYGKNYGP